MNKLTVILVALAMAAALGPLARAADGGGPPREPPAEAYTACQGRSTSEACNVTFGSSTVAGTCTPADDNRLFCRPTNPPGRRPLPPEAFTACSGKAADAACSVAFPDRTVEGTCAQSQGGQLFCELPHPPEAR